MATACAVSSSSPSMAAATSGLLPRVLPSNNALRCVALPARLPAQSSRRLSESRRFPLLHVKASSDETSPVDAGEVFTDLKEKWDAVENKSTVLIYGGGAIVAVWLSSILVGAINSLPLLPKIMELVGLGYTGWFVYRYLLFKSSRKELAEDIESLKKKVAGTQQ